MRSSVNVLVLTFAIAASYVLAQQTPLPPLPAERKEEHAALRAMLVKGSEALNTRNFDGMIPLLHPAFTIVTVDNRKLVGADEFKKYYLGLFDGPQAVLTKLEVRLDADEATRFLDENTGVVYGTSRDTFHFKDGDVREMKTRWSAVTQKEADGWKLVNLHLSASVLDNPVLEAAKSQLTKIAAAAAIAGLLVGAVLALLMRRGRSA